MYSNAFVCANDELEKRGCQLATLSSLLPGHQAFLLPLQWQLIFLKSSRILACTRATLSTSSLTLLFRPTTLPSITIQHLSGKRVICPTLYAFSFSYFF